MQVSPASVTGLSIINVCVWVCTGDIETGVDHLSNAVAVCGQPQQLLQVLQQTLPPQVFQMLLMKLPLAGQVSPIDDDDDGDLLLWCHCRPVWHTQSGMQTCTWLRCLTPCIERRHLLHFVGGRNSSQ